MAARNRARDVDCLWVALWVPVPIGGAHVCVHACDLAYSRRRWSGSSLHKRVAETMAASDVRDCAVGIHNRHVDLSRDLPSAVYVCRCLGSLSLRLQHLPSRGHGYTTGQGTAYGAVSSGNFCDVRTVRRV